MFEKYKNLIREQAWRYTKKWNADYKEVEQESFLIFVKASKKFDEKRKISFSTYLVHSLRELDNILEKEMEEKDGRILFGNLDYTPTEVFSQFEKVIDLHDSIETELSEDAQLMLSSILEGKVKQTPNLHAVKHFFKVFFNWLPSRIEKAWREIERWWLCYEY